MKKHDCVTRLGEHVIIYEHDSDLFCCPVCGSPELNIAPYDEDGQGSFEMCSCGFEFGYDDSKLATSSASDGLEANWDRWRLGLIEEAKSSKEDLQELMNSLNNIEIKLAFDLIPTKVAQP